MDSVPVWLVFNCLLVGYGFFFQRNGFGALQKNYHDLSDICLADIILFFNCTIFQSFFFNFGQFQN